jgi:uncharacterized membrane protein YdfJ with MMPL/SSD domain
MKWIRLLVGALFGGVVLGGASMASFDYANTFGPVSTDLQAALVAVVPIALGIFVIILAIRLGARLVRSFVR